MCLSVDTTSHHRRWCLYVAQTRFARGSKEIAMTKFLETSLSSWADPNGRWRGVRLTRCQCPRAMPPEILSARSGKFVAGCEEHLTRSAVRMMQVSVTRYSSDNAFLIPMHHHAVDVCGDNTIRHRIALNPATSRAGTLVHN